MSKLTKYSFYHKWYIIVCTILSRVFYPQVRLIRFPLDIRNGKNIRLGKGFTCGHKCRFESLPERLDKKEKTISIGDNVEMNDFVHIAALKKVSIGNGVLIASKVFISDINHGSFDEGNDYDINVPPQQQALSSKAVFIEDNVWLGESVCVLSGVTIGKGAIIGAQSVVSKDIPAHTIAVGSPAKVIKKYNSEKMQWERV